MQRLVSSIYFYLLSLIGIVLLIIGIFASVHYVVGITAYDKYPLQYDTVARCSVPATPDKTSITTSQSCLQDIEVERKKTKIADLEKALSFSIIGLIVFCIHFPLALRQKKNS